MKTILNRLFVLALFGLLVVALLWFQGILFRHEPLLAEIPGPPKLSQGAATARVTEVELPRRLVFPGFVEAVDRVELAPRVMARVLQAPPRAGEAVARGQVLLRLDDRDARARLAQAKAAREAAQAMLERAEAALRRVQRLHAAKAATDQDLEAAVAGAKAARAAVARAREAENEAAAALDWFVLRAPAAGRVLERLVDPGDLAVPGRPAVVLYDPAALRLAAAVPEEYAGKLRPGTTLALRFGPERTRRGRVTRVLPAADPRAGTVTVRVRIEDPAGLFPGLLGRLPVPLGRRKTLAIPAAAVARIGQLEFVDRVVAGRLRRTAVRTGRRLDGGRIEILSGLEAGETVVVSR